MQKNENENFVRQQHPDYPIADGNGKCVWVIGGIKEFDKLKIQWDFKFIWITGLGGGGSYKSILMLNRPILQN